MGLTEYKKKRNFKKTPEPTGGKPSKGDPLFVVQEHWASHLHYDFRLEIAGVLKSWAVPKGPSMTVGDKRLAVETEDHPIDYASFEGEIPEGQYGAGRMRIWDQGTWVRPKDFNKQLKSGRLEFELRGEKLKGRWLLQRTSKQSGGQNQWFLIKRHEENVKVETVSVQIPKLAGKPEPIPTEISPQLAQLSTQIPNSDRYIHEVKFDGYRTLAFLEKKSAKKKMVRLLTRNGLDWTNKYKPLDKEIATLPVQSAIFDGEIVALNQEGHSDFSALQTALKNQDPEQLVYYVFDLLYVNGNDQRSKPLEERKQILKKILEANRSSKIRFSSHVRGQGKELFEQASKQGLEGIISKDRTLPYRSGRSSAWLKIKTSQRQELVIGGYTDPDGSRIGFGSLLMGVYEGKKLRYVGRVGTGFDSDTLMEVSDELAGLDTDKSPFQISSPKKTSDIHWVKPKLVAEIEFKAWTSEGILRHASFQGLRYDKPATKVVAEKPIGSVHSESESEADSNHSTSFRITHPERIVYPQAQVRKIDVANFYKSIAPWLLPHIRRRPLSLVRCPDQAGTNCFFQKHIDQVKLPGIQEKLIRDQKVIFIESEEGLLQLVQWGVLEPHPWQCHVDKPLNPDQIIFDLDPDEHVSWKEIAETALKLKKLLERLALKSFLKTTGGKGLHLQVPIAPVYSWENVKEFAKTVSQTLAEENPGKYTINLLKKTRQNKIFLDYLRNGFGATAIAPFSLRARNHPTVAMPLAWNELKDIKSGAEFDFQSALARLARQKKDPWDGYLNLAQRIEILEPQSKPDRRRRNSDLHDPIL